MKAYFFDLDGVLADSRPGLLLSFRAALVAIGLPELSDSELDRFLGTSLPEMFRALKPDVSPSEIATGIKGFRAAYERSGIRQNRLYPGVAEMLKAIGRRKRVSWAVTLKPEVYASQVTQLLGVDRHLQGVVGAGLDETDTKTGLIARALALADVAGRDAIMLGDRHHDITGAIANEVLPVGGLWGYGSHAELFDAGCRHFVRTPAEFQQTFVDAVDSVPAAYGARAVR